MIDDTFTPERISQDRALCDAATPGEWIVNQIKGHTENQIETKHPDFANRKPWGHIVAEVGLCAGDLTQTKFESDSVFIAAARSRWPAALDEIERLQAERAKREAMIRAFVDTCFVLPEGGELPPPMEAVYRHAKTMRAFLEQANAHRTPAPRR